MAVLGIYVFVTFRKSIEHVSGIPIGNKITAVVTRQERPRVNIEQQGLKQEKCCVYNDGISMMNFRQKMVGERHGKSEAMENSTKSGHEGGEVRLK